MKTVGTTTTVLVCAAFAVGLIVGVRSIPDIQRYLKMRRM